MSIWISVDDDVNRLLKWINTVHVAKYGSLAILKRSGDGKDWVYVAGSGARVGKSLRSQLSQADSARLDGLFQQPEGFATVRSEEHTSELQSLMRISYAVFCLKKKNTNKHTQ